MKHILSLDEHRNKPIQVPQDIREAMRLKICDVLGLHPDTKVHSFYHGTSKGNMNKIIRSGKFFLGTWFATDYEISKRYAMGWSRTPAVMMEQIYIGSLYYNGYFTSNEELHRDPMDSVYKPKDMFGQKVH